MNRPSCIDHVHEWKQKTHSNMLTIKKMSYKHSNISPIFAPHFSFSIDSWIISTDFIRFPPFCWGIFWLFATVVSPHPLFTVEPALPFEPPPSAAGRPPGVASPGRRGRRRPAWPRASWRRPRRRRGKLRAAAAKVGGSRWAAKVGWWLVTLMDPSFGMICLLLTVFGS